MLKVTISSQGGLAGLAALQASIRLHSREVLTAVGVRALELARDEFESKSRGGSGVGGPWKPIGPTAVKARVQRMPEYAIWKHLKAGIAAESRKAGDDQQEAFAEARNQLRSEYDRLYAKKDNGKIGKDTGALHASLLRGSEGNSFTLEDMAVEVSTEIRYAAAFDHLRQVLPEEVPTEWMPVLEDVVRDEFTKFTPDHI